MSWNYICFSHGTHPSPEIAFNCSKELRSKTEACFTYSFHCVRECPAWSNFTKYVSGLKLVFNFSGANGIKWCHLQWRAVFTQTQQIPSFFMTTGWYQWFWLSFRGTQVRSGLQWCSYGHQFSCFHGNRLQNLLESDLRSQPKCSTTSVHSRTTTYHSGGWLAFFLLNRVCHSMVITVMTSCGNTVRCGYNAINFLQILIIDPMHVKPKFTYLLTHNRHPIARLWGRVCCEFEV